MANPEYTGPDSLDLTPRALASQTSAWAGALCSLALVAGAAYWSYDLAQRDAYGVPVIKALDGPARVAAADPGGATMANQGLAVNAVAEGEPEAPAEAVALAPEPAELTAEDQPRPVLEAPSDTVMRNSIADALALAGVGDEDLTSPAEPWRPSPRPEGETAQASLATKPVTAPQAALTEVDGASLAPGTRLVQLGAFDSEDVALSVWTDLDKRFGDFVSSKGRIIQRADVGGKTFYRLRLHGFDDLAEARRFCAALIAERADCIPVLVR
ncbi:MAG: SPOR domain-containing protein [Mangrovicoccus sp.]